MILYTYLCKLQSKQILSVFFAVLAICITLLSLLSSTAQAAPSNNQSECQAAGGRWQLDPSRNAFSCFGLSTTLEKLPPEGSFISDAIYKDVSAHQHYRWLENCFSQADINGTTKSEVDNWDFFEGSERAAVLGVMYPGASTSDETEGFRDCKNQSLVKTAFNYLGATNSRDVFCSLTGSQYDGVGDNDVCRAGSGSKNWDNNASNSEVAKSFKDKYESKKPSFGDTEEYVRAYLSLTSQRGCKVSVASEPLYTSASAVPGVSDSALKYAMPVVLKDSEGKFIVRYALGVGSEPGTNGQSPNWYVATSDDVGGVTKTCNQLVQSARNTVGEYVAMIATDPNLQEPRSPSDLSGTTPPEEEKTSCAIDGIGWIICPAMNAMARLNDVALDYLKKWLEVPVSAVTDQSTETAWKSFRDIANVLFVIAFMVIIISQVTGGGRK